MQMSHLTTEGALMKFAAIFLPIGLTTRPASLNNLRHRATSSAVRRQLSPLDKFYSTLPRTRSSRISSVRPPLLHRRMPIRPRKLAATSSMLQPAPTRRPARVVTTMTTDAGVKTTRAVRRTSTKVKANLKTCRRPFKMATFPIISSAGFRQHRRATIESLPAMT